jgi:hypothetical protein
MGHRGQGGGIVGIIRILCFAMIMMMGGMIYFKNH